MDWPLPYTVVLVLVGTKTLCLKCGRTKFNFGGAGGRSLTMCRGVLCFHHGLLARIDTVVDSFMFNDKRLDSCRCNTGLGAHCVVVDL